MPTTYNGVPYYTGGSPVPDNPNANQGYYNPVINPGPQLPPSPPAAGPQPGDVDPSTGNRWSPQHGWLPPNFFTDLDPGGPDPMSNPYAGGPQLPPTLGGLGTVPAGGAPPGNFPVVGVGPTTGQFYEIPDVYQQFFPPDVLQSLRGFLMGRGFTGTGNVGQFGERTYANPGGANAPFNFSLQDLMNWTADARIRSILSWYFGETGQPGFNRMTRPEF